MNLHLAARHWDHNAWCVRFFPEDLPREWRLAYYRNVFHAVVVPWEVWLAAPAEEVGEWREDAGAGFIFFLEWAIPGPSASEPAAGVKRLAELAQSLGDGFGGLLVPVASGTPHSVLKALIEALPQGVPVCVLAAARRQAEALASLLKGRGRTVAWKDDEGVPRWLGDGFVAIHWQGTADLPRLRVLIEVLLRGQGNADAVLVFDGGPPDVEAMRAAATIMELLGG